MKVGTSIEDSIQESLNVKRLHIESVKDWPKDKWLAYRQTGLGCSELGSILGYNQYEEPAIVFAKKLGLIPSGTTDNQVMMMGRVLEPVISSLWSHYDPVLSSWEVTEDNRTNGSIIRECSKPEIYARNDKYPWLFGGPDGLFHHNGDLGVLEVKTISSFASDMYVDGIPTSYLFQIHGYMMLFDCDYAEIAMLKDGRDFSVIPFEKDSSMVEIIENECGEFWHRIEQARELEEMGEDYFHLEPEPTSSEVYEKFLVDRFKAENNLKVTSNDQVRFWVEKYNSFRAQSSIAEKKKRKYSNKIKYFMGNSTEIEGLDNYKVTWRMGAKNRTFSVKDRS